MANGGGASSFSTQANALLRKNLTFQKRNIGANVRLICIPIVICLLLTTLQILNDVFVDKHKPPKCSCTCVDTYGDGKCLTDPACQFGPDTDPQCPIPNPPPWPPVLLIPSSRFRAANSSTDLPNDSCRKTGSCPVTSLFTGNNHSLGQNLATNMLASSFHLNSSDVIGSLANNVLGSEAIPGQTNYLEPAFLNNLTLYNLEPQCTSHTESRHTFNLRDFTLKVRCLQGLNLWRNSSSEINDMLFKGYQLEDSEEMINEFVAAYDLQDSNYNNFNVTIWYNSMANDNIDTGSLLRVPRSVNLVSNAYLEILKGSDTKILFEFVMDMPKTLSSSKNDIVSQMGPLFFTWIILLLFPVVLQSLVYEKQQKLRIMMKMHGLGDGPYWLISYAYFLAISVIYMLCFALFGFSVGLKFFMINDYNIQFVFYFIHLNLQVSSAFLVATMFSNVKTATVFGHITVFGSGLLGAFMFQEFVEDPLFPSKLPRIKKPIQKYCIIPNVLIHTCYIYIRIWLIIMECFPGFSLYRGLYELGMSATEGFADGTSGMKWGDLSHNGMKEVLIIMLVEWFIVVFVAYYIDQAISFGNCHNPLFYLRKKKHVPSRKPSLQRQGSKDVLEKHDVIEESEKVEEILGEPSAITSYAIVCDRLAKVYPGQDGNPNKFAVKGLSLALPHGECFGMLGPNGAGKTSFISMMIGLTKPSSGVAFVKGLNIQTDLNEIYTSMGVCPQHDLLWDTLTGREHLLFYGRLKNLKGSALTQAVEKSLKNLNLFHGGVADKQARKYSGGMKRRLSVAISLIGDPKVVYMDEPSTGLDPASRNSLWNVVKQAKCDRAIIITTHSMEEAEALCDRLGIFVDGDFQCIGNSKELKARYGGTYVFTMTTSANNEEEIEGMVKSLSPNAKKIYQLAGTQKFELPKDEVRIADVFQAVDAAKRMFTVFAWGLADTTLEDVFIKVAHGAQAFNTLS